MEEIDAMSAKILADGIAFGGCHPAFVGEEVVDGSAAADREVDAEQIARTEGGQG